MKRTILSLVVLASLCVLGFAPRADAQDNHECSNASLKGAYGGYSSGTVVPGGTPRVALFRSTFDGKGHNFTVFIINDNGTVTTTTSSGTYIVNADCTGAIFPSFGGTRAIVVVDGGKEYDLIGTDPPSTVSYSVGKKLFRKDDEES